MKYKRTTLVPNEVFDLLPTLTFSELKILLCIIRHTYGWKVKNGNKRKTRDRISYSQFEEKTGVARRSISSSIQSLITKQHIRVTDYSANLLHTPESRKGKTCIYYAPLFIRCAIDDRNMSNQQHKPMRNRVYNKTNGTKIIRQKGSQKGKRISDWERIQQIMQENGH